MQQGTSYYICYNHVPFFVALRRNLCVWGATLCLEPIKMYINMRNKWGWIFFLIFALRMGIGEQTKLENRVISMLGILLNLLQL